MKLLSFPMVVVVVICFAFSGTAQADTKAIKDLVKNGGPLQDADAKGKDLVDRITDPNNTEDPTTARNDWNKKFFSTAATASKAALNVPLTTANPPKPGLWSKIKNIFKSVFSFFSGTSGTTPTNKATGATHGDALAENAIYTIDGTPFSPGGTFALPYIFTSFSDAFGSATVARYAFDLSITSDITDIAGKPFLTTGLGFITSEQIIDLDSDFGFSLPQYQIITFENVPDGGGTFTAHFEGWAASEVPEPSTVTLIGIGAAALAVCLERKRRREDHHNP